MACDVEFIPPPEAPVFEPTEEEFADPLAYVAKIKPLAEKTGICKIRPPPKWEPPFAINIEEFRFTPRVQRLNELEALSRVKLNFLDKLARFWELQGYRLRIPNVERKSLDLHRLHKNVHAEGGFEKVCQERQWVQIAVSLGYTSANRACVSSTLRNHYERILYPFDLFEAGVSLQPDKWIDTMENNRLLQKSSSSVVGKKAKRSRRSETNVDEIDYSANKELRKLQFFGPGPKAAVPPVKGDGSGDGENAVVNKNDGSSDKPIVLGPSPVKSEPNLNKEVSIKIEVPDIKIAPEKKEIKTSPQIKLPSETEVPSETQVPSETKVQPETYVSSETKVPSDIKVPSETNEKKEVQTKAKNETPQKIDSPKTRMATRMSTPTKSPRPYSPVKSPRKCESLKRKISESKTASCQNQQSGENLEEDSKKMLDQYICLVCKLGDRESYLLLCDECDDAYHTFCLIPHLPDVPHGDWRCPKCVAKVCNRPPAEYGFEQSKTQYSLECFGEMADKFKTNYFKNDLHLIPTEKVEQEFWRLVQSLGEDVVVEYGADIHAADNGSGFPTAPEDCPEADQHYTRCGWNLNVLPVVEKSVLRFINVDISGMKIPWCYVGMCFSCFCWHIEDHWSYSINYLHWGEPKTWYGVSSHDADKFENAMKKQAPELFEQSPDLLHHITTIMNPNVLMKEGVPIVRTNQHAGEFVITFPRAYHAGFNNGYNFAEAVNFCPADWLPMGRICVDHYAALRRNCVFSHDELVCRMAGQYNALDVTMATRVCSEMMVILEQERQLRKQLLDAGVRTTKREEFELLADDHRMCICCRTTCFLSAVTCKCGVATRMSCPKHADELCSCDPSRRTLRYRYALDELTDMIGKLRDRMDSYSAWQKKVEGWLLQPKKTQNTEKARLEKPTFTKLQEMIEEAKVKEYAIKDEKAADLVKRLNTSVTEAEPLIRLARDFFVHERRRTTRTRGDNIAGKLSVEEYKKFVTAVEGLPCQVPDISQLYDLLYRIENFQTEAAKQLSMDRSTRDVNRIEELIDFGLAQDIALPECNDLKKILIREKWLLEVDKALTLPSDEDSDSENKDEDSDDLAPGSGDVEIQQLSELIEEGESLQQHPEVHEAIQKLKDLRACGLDIEEKAKWHLSGKSVPEIVSRYLNEGITAYSGGSDPRLLYLPLLEELRKALKIVWKWCDDYKQVMDADRSHYPTLSVLEALLDRAQRSKVLITPIKVDKVDAHVRLAKGWLDQTSRFFLRRRATISLMEVLLPRTGKSFDPVFYQSIFLSGRKSKTRPVVSLSVAVAATQENCVEFLKKVSDSGNETTGAYTSMVETELSSIHRLRQKNIEKVSSEGAEVVYCLCRQNIQDFMLQCELCRDWFHGGCVPLPKILDKASSLTRASCGIGGKSKKGAAADKPKAPKVEKKTPEWADPHESQQMRDLKYLCPQCQRGRRPELGTIYGLLVSLQQLPVRIPEGEALQLLTERAMSWQDTVHDFLSSEDNPEVRAVFLTYVRIWSIEPPEELKRRIEASGMPDSSVFDHVVQESTGKGTKEIQFNVDENSRSTMESLLVEGDLIEVSLEETKWLWQMLQMIPPPPTPPESDGQPETPAPSSSSESTERAKRKGDTDVCENTPTKQTRVDESEVNTS